MASSPIQLLLVEDNPGDARLVREAMRDAHEREPGAPRYVVTVVERVADAITALSMGPGAEPDKAHFDVVLLDLSLPDSQGFTTFERVHAAARDVPVVLLTRGDDDSIGVRAMREGAQDYLSKSDFDVRSLARSLRYARERKEAERDRLRLVRAETAHAEADAHRGLLQAALAEAETQRARLRAIFEQAPVAVSVLRAPDQVFEVANARYESLVGRRGLAGQTFRAAFPELAADAPTFALVDRVFSTGEPVSSDEYRVRLDRLGDGVLRDVYFLFTCQPVLDTDGRVSAVITVAVDVTAQVLARRSLAVLAAAGAALSEPLDSNATLEKVAQLVVPGLADSSSVHLRDDAGAIKLVAAAHVDPAKVPLLHAFFALQSGGNPHGHALVIRTGESELLTDFADGVLAAAAPDDASRRVLGELGITSAMTVPLTVAGRTFGALTFLASESRRRYGPEDLRLAEELGRRVALALDSARLYQVAQRERQRVEEANRSKDEFLSVASHELRTPLNAILGWSRMLRSGSVPEARREKALETIERNANVQVQLVEDILDLSRITTGKLRIDVATIEAAHVADAAVDVVRPAAEAKGVTLQVLLDPEAGVVRADAARLQQIVWNLLANAVKFTPSGGRVDLEVTRDDTHVQLVVSDTGRGIDPKFLPYVFDPFRQADGSITRTYGGLGLGLAIVKHLVELHGGQIEAGSEGVGKGAIFTVRLPVAPPPSPRPEGCIATPRTMEAWPGGQLWCPPQIDGLRVVIVDDEPDARELLESILAQCKALVVVARSANEAFELVKAHLPDVLVSDIGMPDEDGYSLIRRIRALPPGGGGSTPAIALTAYARAEDRTRALMEGFNSHVSKPVEPQELVAVVAAAAGRHVRALS